MYRELELKRQVELPIRQQSAKGVHPAQIVVDKGLT